VINISEIEDAAARIEPVVVKTPLIYSLALNEIAGGSVYLKAENLQRTGSFKIRGAYNLLSQLDDSQVTKGVVAWSSGNHAQGVAAAGSILGIKTAIVMPEDAPSAKIENTRRLGGEVVLYDRYTQDREAIARSLAAERGATIVPSYDHAHIIAGQGTVGLEIMSQANEMDVQPDQVLVCCGGGGLISGSAIAIKSACKSTRVYPVEPVEFDDTARSLKSNSREKNSPEARSICDALQTESPGKMTFEINRRLLSEGLTVTDDEVRQAIRFAFQHLKLVVEPGGAVALAAVLSGKIDTSNKITVAVLSGGNVDVRLFADIQSE
jgi:threonine dehydratase